MVFGFGRRKKPLVLHVDDEPDIVGFVKAGLTAVGAEVITADNGADGYALAQSKLPDLILLDIRMPLTDGFEVCHRLKSEGRTKKIPIIMVTALGQMRDVEKALGMGAEAYLVKPFDMPKLFAKVSEFITLKQS